MGSTPLPVLHVIQLVLQAVIIAAVILAAVKISTEAPQELKDWWALRKDERKRRTDPDYFFSDLVKAKHKYEEDYIPFRDHVPLKSVV